MWLVYGWFALVYVGLRWFALVCAGLRWFALVCVGLRWFVLGLRPGILAMSPLTEEGPEI